MQQYIIRRVLWLIPVLFFISLITFALMHSVPGGPWDREKKLAPSVVENLNARYGLDKPLAEQYLSFVGNALHGDLGVSFSYQDRKVTSVILEGLPVTATLAVSALLVAMLVGIPLGILAALKQNSWADYLCLFFATVGASVPNFVMAMILIIVFSVGLHWLPTNGWGTWQKAVMPALALGLYHAALLARMTRASMIEALRQDFVRTARAKGLVEHLILFRHIIKNALIPVVTILGPVAAGLIAGSFIIESIFAVPGVGKFFIQGIFARDYGLMMGTTLFYAVVIALANLAVDILYGFIDPRIRYQ
ncbi:MAG TPA: ABC transporter permease [Chloroflexota bacterium]|nr:ABC transporter permease [Chloroflexota bacterium]HEX2987649.1 ABC transporter permease [Chloroflexota bacterium]